MEPYKGCVGRRREEKADIFIEDPFLNDYTKILQSKAYRRSAYKTQVLCLPDNPHARTRLVHTNEVIAISLIIAEQLGLNKNLCMAIAAGHDMGHTPYGHIGETVLSDFSKKRFKHPVYGVVIAQHIERRARGLNLAYETQEGILYHARGSGELKVDRDKPQEYSAVMFADKIAYTFSDLNDAIRYNYLDEQKLPECALKLGNIQRERTNNAISALVRESREKGFVQFSEGKTFEQFNELKSILYDEFYHKIDFSLHENILYRLCEFFSDYFSDKEEFKGIHPVVAVSLLTDKEATQFSNLLMTTMKPSLEDIKRFGVLEILPHLKGKSIDFTDPDLGWGEDR